MNIVSPETVQKILDGGENLAKVVTGSASELSSEAINLFIISSSLEVLKFSVVFIIFYIVKKYCDTIMDKESDQKIFKAFKTTALILSLIFFTTQSFPHLESIAKAFLGIFDIDYIKKKILM